MASKLFRQDSTDRDSESKTDDGGRNGGPGSGDPTSADRLAAARRRSAATEGPPGPSVIGTGTEISGEITMRGDFRVEGRIDGNVTTRGEVVISDRGRVKGEIEADVVVIEGIVEGAVRAREVVRLKRGCKVSADLRSPAVELEEGGGFEGRINMAEEAAKGGGAVSRPTGSAGSRTGEPVASGASAGSSRGGAGPSGEEGSPGESSKTKTDADEDG